MPQGFAFLCGFPAIVTEKEHRVSSAQDIWKAITRERVIWFNLKNRNVKIAASKFRTAETLVNTVSSKFWNGFLQGIFSIYWVCGPLPNFGRLNSANLLVSQKLVKFQGY